MGKALLFDALEKKGGSVGRRVQHVGIASDDDNELEKNMQTLSVSESLPG